MAYTRTFSSLGCPELDLEQTLALAARHGLPGVELRCLSGTIDLPAARRRRVPDEAVARGARP
jgi:hypothetical protein